MSEYFHPVSVGVSLSYAEMLLIKNALNYYTVPCDDTSEAEADLLLRIGQLVEYFQMYMEKFNELVELQGSI